MKIVEEGGVPEGLFADEDGIDSHNLRHLDGDDTPGLSGDRCGRRSECAEGLR
jgi:hypothetical protein